MRRPAAPASRPGGPSGRGRRLAVATVSLALAWPGSALAQEATAPPAGDPPVPDPTPARPAPLDSVRVTVDIAGIEGELQRNAEAVLTLKLQEGNDLSPARARSLHRRAEDELKTALEPYGRYRATVEGDLAENGGEWRATYRVDPGPPLLVGPVRVTLAGEGAADSGFVALRDSFPLSEGDTLRHAPYEAAKSAFSRHAVNHGYFDARFDTAQIRIDRGAYTSEIVLHFETGPRYRFGPITIEQDALDPEYVNGYVTAEQGEPFDAALLRAAQVDLTTGPVFGRADIQIDREAAGDDLEVPVTFVLQPVKSQRYELAAGYGTDTGLRGSIGAQFRRLNRKAHNAEAELTVSQIETSVGARYNVPRPFPSTSVYSAFGSYGDVSPTWSDTRVGTVGLSWAHTRGPFRETWSLQWEGSSYSAAGSDGDASLLIPQVQWSWVEANDRIVATKGHRLGLTLNGALDGALSSTSFFSALLDGKIIRSVAGGRIRGLARGQLGWISVGDITDLPPTRRFVAGGDQSVRGYSYESIGPDIGPPSDPDVDDDEEQLLIGGDALVVGSLEADYEVIRNWRLAAFFDAGNALDGFSDVELETGAGVGIRWVSPVGMVRFDGAWALSQPGSPWRIHFVLGPDL